MRDYDLECLRNQISIVQQEPLLFNETIKSNIKFGDLKASDARILEVAIQANALQFIMQNDEDYGQESVKLRLAAQFKELIAARASQYRKIGNLLQMAKDGAIDFKCLMFVNQMLPFFLETGLQHIEGNFELFISVLKTQAERSDCTWQKILMAMDFEPDRYEIERYLRDSKLPDSQVKEIQLCLATKECQFNLKTVMDFETVYP